ncbi:unnamed protein product [Pylaiella littoralis]
MDRESYLLRQRAAARGDAGDAGDAASLGSILVSPLDSDEQERVVAEIATDANNQSNLFTRVFSALLLVCSVALVRCSVQLLLSRGNGGHLPHRAFLEGVPDAAFHATYAGQLLGLYLAHRVARGSGWHILPGFMVSWTSLFSWLAVFRRFGVTNPLFFWMPFGPAVLLVAAVYLFMSHKKLESDVEELKRARYTHKEL